MVSPLHNLGLPFRSFSTNIRPEGITAHYGGSSPWRGADRSSSTRFRDSTDHRRCATIVRGWHDFHRRSVVNGGRGWTGLAYNSVICPHGHRYEGRGPGRRSGANGTDVGNYRSYAVVYIGGDSDPITDEAKRAFHDEVSRLGQPLRWNHSNWKSTQCAGPAIKTWQSHGWPNPPREPFTMSQYDEIIRRLDNIGSAVWGYPLRRHGVDASATAVVVDTLISAQRGISPLLRSVADAVGAQADPEAVAELVVESLRPILREELADAIPEADADAIVDAIARRLAADES